MSASNDVWEVLSTARTIRRFTDEPVDDATLTRCLEARAGAERRQRPGLAVRGPAVPRAARRGRGGGPAGAGR